MAISSLVPVASSYIPGGMSVTVPEQYRVYQVEDPKNPGFYTITTNLSNYQVTLDFYNASGVQQTVTTSSGTVTAELTQAYLGYFIKTLSNNTNVICTLTQTAGSSNSDRVTNYGSNITEVTSSSTYNETGMLYVLAVGGGGGGGFYRTDRAGGGGGSGAVVGGFAFTNSPTTITIGNGGNGGSANASGNSGGTTSFGNFISAGGGGSNSGPSGGGQGSGGGGGNGGNGGWTGNYQPRPNSGGTGNLINKRVRSGTNGGGGGGYGGTSDGGATGGGQAYENGGIGVGGKGGSSNTNGTSGTGYGAGGGGAGGSGPNTSGGPGTAGIVWVLNGVQL